MLNALTIIGSLLILAGAALVLRGLFGVVKGIIRRTVYRKKPLAVEGQGIYAGAVTAAEVYVPGTILRRFALALLGLAVAALGAPLLWAGAKLATDWVAVAPSGLLARVTAGDRVRIDLASGRAIEARLGAPVLVANAEIVTFRGHLARLRLGTYARLTHVTGYRDAAAVLGRHGLARLEVAPADPLDAWLERLAQKFPDQVEVRRRWGLPFPRGAEKAEVWATGEGLEWRR